VSWLHSIGGLADALRSLDPALPIYIDNRPPTALSSYRGYYDHLAIERSDRARAQHSATELDGRGQPFELNMAGYGTYTPGHGEVRIKAPATVTITEPGVYYDLAGADYHAAARLAVVVADEVPHPALDPGALQGEPDGRRGAQAALRSRQGRARPRPRRR
jgi:hypothetical protein